MTRQAFYPIEHFPQLAELASHWQTIRDEALQLNAPVMPIDRINKSHQAVADEVDQHLKSGGSYGWTLGFGGPWGPNPNWLQYGLVLNGQSIMPAQQHMPGTVNLINALPGIHLAALVRLKANTLLGTHRHDELPAAQLLQMHLTLETATDNNFAYLNVDGEFHQHSAGKAVVFDGSLPHFALNASAQERLILYLEFHWPSLMKASE